MITGLTRIYGIIADPISHVQTPREMNALFAAEGVDGVLVPMHVSPHHLPDFIKGVRAMQNFGGMIATVPHKPSMIAFCDQLEGDAAAIGAVNAVRRDADGTLVGAMLDGKGFIGGLRAAGINVAGMNVCLLGAGGAGAAIAFGLAEAKVDQLTIVNRSREKAEELAHRVVTHYPTVRVCAGEPSTRERDLIVNATSLGLKPGDALPLADLDFHPGQIVSDAIMEPAETPFLAAARRSGARIHPGLPMLKEQIRLMAVHLGALPALS